MARSALAQCVGCGRRFDGARRRSRIPVCTKCEAGLRAPSAPGPPNPKPPKKKPVDTPEAIQQRLHQMEERDWRQYIAELAALDRGDPQVEREVYASDQPGYPLGAGMPLGRTLRRDGESHRQAWMRLLRLDPCAYCGGDGGTLDHIEPKSLPVRGIGGAHAWTNYTGACGSCNNSKQTRPLLEFMLVRARSAPAARSGRPRAAA